MPPELPGFCRITFGKTEPRRRLEVKVVFRNYYSLSLRAGIDGLLDPFVIPLSVLETDPNRMVDGNV